LAKVFVQDFMIVERPSRELAAALQAGAGALVLRALGEAESDFEQLRLKIGPHHWPALLTKTVEVSVGAMRTNGDVTLFAFSWRAAGAGSVFPVLDADLEVSPLDDNRSELAVRGRYDPPGGPVGRGVDRLILHRVADATIRAFLSRLAARLAASEVPAQVTSALA
jgi:hypothetical protein